MRYFIGAAVPGDRVNWILHVDDQPIVEHRRLMILKFQLPSYVVEPDGIQNTERYFCAVN
jgi:hypothetical protein